MIRSDHSLLLLCLAVACARGGHTDVPTIDSDGDGILDVHEGDGDPDGDGVPNFQDLDSDGDGLTDADERGDDDPETFPFDSDRDRIPDFVDLDSDGNGIADSDERFRGRERSDADQDGTLDAHDLDDDNDGAPDLLELRSAGLDRDSDEDGDADRYDEDSDDDGVEDRFEVGPVVAGALYDHDGDGIPDALDLDSDDDGITDRDERGDAEAPRDTDADGRGDFHDADADNDGLSDDVDLRIGDPLLVDTDGDGVRDGTEVLLSTDPRDPGSHPGLPLFVVRPRTEREELRALEVDVGKRRVDVIYLASARDYQGFSVDHHGLIIQGLGRELIDEDVHVGAAAVHTYHPLIQDSYARRGWVSAGPFVPLSPITSSETALTEGLAGWPSVHGAYGGDGGLEAIRQVITGSGYDSQCDGIFDPATDALPWHAHVGDPFAGTASDNVHRLGVASGGLPGLGRREFAMPLIVLSMYDAMHDPGGPLDGIGGDPDAEGCPTPVSSPDIAKMLQEQGGQFVLFDYQGRLDTAPYFDSVIEVFDAYDDLDGDGVRDDPLIVRGGSYGEDYADTVPGMVADLKAVIERAIQSRDFSRVDFTLAGDHHGLVVSIDPQSVPVSDTTSTVGVTLGLRGTVPPAPTDQVFRLELLGAGDGTVSLGSQPFYVVVPGYGLD